jgi:methionine synthase reductase
VFYYSLELVVEPFIDGLWPALDRVFNPQPREEPDVPHVPQDVDETLQLLTITTPDAGYTEPRETSSRGSDDYSEFVTSLRGSGDQSWSTQSITLPPLQSPYIDVKLNKLQDGEMTDFPYTEAIRGIAMAQITMASINNRRVLTTSTATKLTIELELHWESDSLGYLPGDALCVVCPNDACEVDYIMERLKLQSMSNDTLSLSILPNTTKRNPVIPRYIPSTSCTVYHYFMHCADIRSVPKKGFLRVLAEYCGLEFEKQRLLWLSSRQGYTCPYISYNDMIDVGAQDYRQFILDHHVDILDILHSFPSCHPPLSILIENLPRLQPRYYSVVSSPLLHKNITKIAFNITTLPPKSWGLDKTRYGLCTGWLNELALKNDPMIPCVPLYPRLKNPFHLPDDPMIPLIMIGPGTGVAPFIGFLQHRECLKAKGVTLGESWLFFGCRHYNQDHLYRTELEMYLSSCVLTYLDVSYSQLHEEDYKHGGDVRYVQDKMRDKWERLSHWIMDREAVVYVCGDANNMMVDIKEAMMDVIQKYITDKDITSSTSTQIFKELMDSNRYIIDLWN